MFTHIVLATAASVWLVGAQAAGSNMDHVHAAFAFIRTGERTPILRSDTQRLTAVGANQMYTLGQNFRTRYIADEKPNGLRTERIANLSTDILNNDQIRVQTLDTPYLVSSAQALMQALYPPHSISNGTADTTGVLADGTTVDYPLNGYQYASIQAASQDDPKTRIVSGAQNCPMAQVDGLTYLTTNQFQETYGATEGLYKSLTPEWFEGYLGEDDIDYKSAQEIYDYVNYQYTHNSSIHSTLANDTLYTGVYDQLRFLADEEAWYMYGNTSSSTSTTPPNRAIGGSTLASEVLNTFRILVASKNNTSDQKDTSHPLTLYFGEQDAMMSLLSLLMLDYISPDFKAIPSYGSAMVFELFSTGDNAEVPSDPEDLWVRFSFHNGTSDYSSKQLTSYPMFNTGRSNTDMLWPVFQDYFAKIGLDSVADWCTRCNSGSSFCRGADGSGVTLIVPSPHDRKKKEVSPAVAGVIGAVVSLFVAALLFALAMLIGGIRFHRVERRQLGGFKGPRKLASDPDLSLAKNDGAIVGFGDSKKGHERVGSWELRQKEFGKDVRHGRSESEDSFGAIDDVARRPVEAHQRI